MIHWKGDSYFRVLS